MKLTIHGMSNDYKRVVKQKAEDLFPQNKVLSTKEIVISNLDSTTAPRDDGKVYINLYSASSGRKTGTLKSEFAWAHDFCGVNHKTFRPSKNSVPLCHPYDKWNSGEMVGDNFYIFFDICSCGLRTFSYMIENFFRQISEIYSGTPAEYQESGKQHYVDLTARRLSNDSEGHQKQLEQLDKQLRDAQTTVNTILGQRHHIAESIAKMSEKGIDETMAVIELEKLKSLPKVVDVLVNNRYINVFTKNLSCVDPRTGIAHNIGKFRIMIDTKIPQIRWFNLTRRIEACESRMQAPHVFPDGHACMGSASKPFHELLKHKEYSTAILLGIQFVESVNVEDSAGKYIRNWPTSRGRS